VRRPPAGRGRFRHRHRPAAAEPQVMRRPSGRPRAPEHLRELRDVPERAPVVEALAS
jgi:hypothetical protein